MSESRELTLEIRQWVEKAEHDFRNAEYVLTMPEDCPFDTVTYHCQQCVEKYLKAVLVYRSVDFPKTHDLVVLFNLLGKGRPLGLKLQDVQPLNRYSIESRYPGDWDRIEENEAKAALEMTRRVRDAVRKSLRSILSEKALE